jgi:hypothetical protein
MIRWLILSALSLGTGGQIGTPAQEPEKPEIVVVIGRVYTLSSEALDEMGLSSRMTATLRIQRVLQGQMTSREVTIHYIRHDFLPEDTDIQLRMRRGYNGRYLVCRGERGSGYICD